MKRSTYEEMDALLTQDWKEWYRPARQWMYRAVGFALLLGFIGKTFIWDVWTTEYFSVDLLGRATMLICVTGVCCFLGVVVDRFSLLAYKHAHFIQGLYRIQTQQLAAEMAQRDEPSV